LQVSLKGSLASSGQPLPMNYILLVVIQVLTEKWEPMGNHYVPQKYLRGFTDPSCPEALWQFDKKTLLYSEHPASIARIAQQRSFYDSETEQSLHELVERPGNGVLDKLRSGDLSLKDEERRHLSVYIATMLKRVPHHRAKAEVTASDVLRKVTSEFREQIRAYEHAGRLSAETAGKRLAETDAVEAKYALEMPDNVREQIRSPWPTQAMIDLVYGMSWRFVFADGDQYFLVTDNPAFFFECYGLGGENSELTFPVSCILAIFGSWTPVVNGNRIGRGTQFVKEANRRLISAAFRFIYPRGKVDWIRKVAMKDQPHLSRIIW